MRDRITQRAIAAYHLLEKAKELLTLPTSTCPACRYEMDASKCLDDPAAAPEAEDLSVCFNCGEILQFNDILVLKPISESVLEELDGGLREQLLEASNKIKRRGRIH